jgi:post-segregation antitoxin (ccd killing protein)
MTNTQHVIIPIELVRAAQKKGLNISACCRNGLRSALREVHMHKGKKPEQETGATAAKQEAPIVNPIRRFTK